jgi:hypothetical protein
MAERLQPGCNATWLRLLRTVSGIGECVSGGCGSIVRELPGRNLVRASCGWWTNEDDLQRLVAGLVSS